MLTFDEAKHEYRWHGQVVPHVTGILAPLVDYSMVDPEDLARAQEFGRRQHRLVELECKGDLDPDALDPFWRPHLFALRTCIAETGLRVLASERKVFHHVYGYAGQLDLEVAIYNDEGIIDVKKSFSAGRATGPQLAAYLEARNEERKRAGEKKKLRTRHALRLVPESKPPYRLKEFTDPDDFGCFVGLLKVQRWKEKHP